MNTPVNGLPTIDERMIVRWRLGYLLAFLGALVGGVVWATCFWIKVERMSEDLAEIKLDIKRIQGISPVITGGTVARGLP